MMNTYLVWCPENGEARSDAREFEAYTHDDAAEKWARRYDSYSTEYSIVSEQWTPEVCVAMDGEPERHFLVTGEAVPHYEAHPVSADRDGEYYG
ncbi:hypothetical protein [Martelella alba]|uniref:Uncharacterized protein n=1 Tax=Martelella alba TaxID=2590451 RepID=A0ABY2SEM2_9HYPH|nr:hypothetical protein [Martelella alba]TKI02957.1 hypothetical protein FCN80_23390 [Martelella alba]